MSRGGKWAAGLVAGEPQTRVCVCDPPAVFSDTEGRCVKCGHQAMPAPAPTPADDADAVAARFAEIINR